MITFANGHTIGYDDVGTGIPVLFLHGFPHNRSLWAPQLGALATAARTISMDLRGFGESVPGGAVSMGDYADDAAALLDALLARYPDKADFWLLQAHTFLGMKRPLRAAENLELLDRLGKSTVDSLNTLGDIYVNEGLMDLALRAYERSIVLDPKQPIARPLRSAEILSARSAVPQARKLTALLREAAGDRLEPNDQRKLLKVEARLSMAEGNSSKATVAMLEEIVKLDPLDGEALMLLGQHYSRENEPDRAIFYYERAEGIEAFEANAKVRHAQVLVRLNRYAEAVPLLRRAQEQKPREDVARYLEQIDRVAKSKK